MRTVFVGLACALMLAPGLASAEEPSRVWVFFTDHGRSPAQLELELQARRVELGTRTLARRAKVRDDGLVDARDLLPAASYVDAVAKLGGEVHVQSRWLNAVSVEASPEVQAQLEALPFVRQLRPVSGAGADELELLPAPMAADPEDYGISWDQLELLGVPDVHDCGLSGAGVLIGVQDTGFRLVHQALANTEVVATYDFLNEDDNVGPQMGDPPTQHVHGTVVLATITGDDPGTFRGAAPAAAVLLSKTEDVAQEEPFEEDAYVAGLEWIEGMGADIFTASLSYIDWYSSEDFDGATAVTTLAVEAAVANGLIVFVPMGNTGPDPSTLGAPADAPGAITLGAVNPMGQLAGFSSRGPTADGRIKPDVVAPGWQTVSVHAGSMTQYSEVNGTSIATPIAAGVGALLLEAYPWLTPADMAELLRSTASQGDAPDNDYGYGIIDAWAAAELYCTCTDLDGDSYFDEACGGTDCVDDSADAYPGAPELCDGLDNDCDGAPLADELDADDDGFLACAGDCDDDDGAVNPEAAEICDNGIDDDCDELVDAQDPDCMSGGDGDGDGDDPAESGEGSGEDTGDAEAGESESGESGAGLDEAGSGGCACALGQEGSEPEAPGFALFGLLVLGALRRRST